MEKYQDGYKKNLSKTFNIRDRETRPFPPKKIASIFTATGNIFSKICSGICHWVTGIIKPNGKNML